MGSFYVAGKTHDFMKVRVAQEMVRMAGHRITHDWTLEVQQTGTTLPKDNELRMSLDLQRDAAMKDLNGVYAASTVIVICGHPNLCGTLIEVGAALATGKDIWHVGPFPRYSIFFALPAFTELKDFLELEKALQKRA
jgi:hypothetical protein